ncbi:MAG: hypothetical protein M1115_07745 [Actinobacteria bacterium]|nr:hypothetical protein [Actinomycetota bacterium]
MKYVDAGYTIVLVTLFAYAILVRLRLARLRRADRALLSTEALSTDPGKVGDLAP